MKPTLVFEPGYDRYNRRRISIQHRHEGAPDGLGGTLHTFVGNYDPVNDRLFMPTEITTAEMAEIVLKCRNMREEWKK